MEIGNSYIVHVHIDEESYRIVASAKVERYFAEDMPPYKRGEEVDILIWQKTDLGFKVIIDNRYPGLAYEDQIFKYVHTGDRMKGYIAMVRPDGKIDVTLQRTGRKETIDFAATLLQYLKEHGGKNISIGQMTVKTAFGTGEVMVVFEEAEDTGGRYKKGKGKKKSSGKFEIPDAEALIEMLDDAVYSLSDDEDEQFFALESVALINKGKSHILAGKPTITDEFERTDGRTVRYEIGTQSFFQVNPEQMVKLYDMAAEYADLKGGETVLDLYCGAGTIGIWLLDELRSRDEEAFGKTRVIGIESVKPAVIDANRNSVINNMVNTRYFAGRAEEELPGMMGLAELWKWNEVNERVKREPEIIIDKADVVILDPPRAGCDEALLAAVVTASPDRIVYVSCDPATLARDIKNLTSNGYEFIEATPVDQFPWTSHVEVIARIQKQKP